jgi:hypothetical protein
MLYDEMKQAVSPADTDKFDVSVHIHATPDHLGVLDTEPGIEDGSTGGSTEGNGDNDPDDPPESTDGTRDGTGDEVVQPWPGTAGTSAGSAGNEDDDPDNDIEWRVIEIDYAGNEDPVASTNPSDSRDPCGILNDSGGTKLEEEEIRDQADSNNCLDSKRERTTR